MRKKNTDISHKEEMKILIMDNPFAKTNAEHLLDPMFEIAKNYKIQLICFSGIGGSSVYSQFNRIYAAKAITDRFQNKERVEFKEEKGENEPLRDTSDTLEMDPFVITQEKLF
jgi:hypothetical protein